MQINDILQFSFVDSLIVLLRIAVPFTTFQGKLEHTMFHLTQG